MCCPSCKYWNASAGGPGGSDSTEGVFLEDITSADVDRIQTGPWDRCFGWGEDEVPGIVRGSSNIIGGAPGAGKSTMFLHMCEHVALNNREGEILYLSAEEILPQIRARADRLGVIKRVGQKRIRFVDVRAGSANLDVILKKHKFLLLICDSLKAISTSNEDQIAICKAIKSYADFQHAPAIISHHVTKEGEDMAGLMSLQHEVDATLTFFPIDGPKVEGEAVRELETTKNRNGRAWVTAHFAMTEKGLIELPEGWDKEEEEEEEEDDE